MNGWSLILSKPSFGLAADQMFHFRVHPGPKYTPDGLTLPLTPPQIPGEGKPMLTDVNELNLCLEFPGLLWMSERHSQH